MENQICYCAVDGRIAAVRNHDNTAGAPPPELLMGMPCELRLRLFANCADTTPYPPARFSGIAGWGFVMDTDFSPLSTVKLVADNADIRLEEVEDGGETYTQIAIPITSTHTAELAAALDGKECIALAGELIGYDSGHAEVFVLQIKGITVRGRVAGLEDPVPIPTAAYEALTQEFVNAAIASGGLVSSGAVTSMINACALPKNAPFRTTVGPYTMTYTSNGGFSVYGSGASVTLSGGSVAVSAYQGAALTYENEDEAMEAHVSAGFGGVDVYYNDTEYETTLNVGQGVTANGSAITQVSSGVDDTVLEIDTLEGGVKYVCSSALTALSIGAAVAGCNGTIIFTVASGAIVTPPANVDYFGVTSYTPGAKYIMMVNDFAAVCNEAVAPGV